MNSREIVYATLEKRRPERIARHMMTLDWAEMRYADVIQKISAEYPNDICMVPPVYHEPFVCKKGNPSGLGQFTDEWGCMFDNILEGVMGECKQPLVEQDDWSDYENIHIPEEMLSFDVDEFNQMRNEKYADKFLVASTYPRPFERLQFIRGTENLFIDLFDIPPKMYEFLEKMHDFHCRLMEKWANTNVDALMMMDDWGSQRNLLISPKLWEEIFMPMYADYIQIAHSHGKKIFMHSDGNILSILPKLIDLGLDAINAQIFCMGLENLEQFRGKITFWGEIDRQNVLPFGTPEDVENSIREIQRYLWDDGGVIAQFEFGAGTKPENILPIFPTWDRILKEG